MQIQKRYTNGANQGAAKFEPVKSPFDQSIFSEVELTDAETALRWLNQAQEFHRSGQLQPAETRAKILETVAAQIETAAELFAELIAKEGGKPFKDSVVEVARACQTLRLCAIEAISARGTEIPMRASKAASGHLAFTVREPIGVVLAISAFNHPLNLIAHQVGSAIASGCPVIVKPARETPLSCIHLVSLLRDAGLAKEQLRWIYCDNETAQAMAESPLISYLSFIGSAKVGWHLRSVVAPGTRVALEHGGAAPVIIDETAKLDEIIPQLVRGAYYHSGQVCVSVQRIFVHAKIRDEFIKKLQSAVAVLKTGDASDRDTDCGPIIREKDVTRILEWIDEAVRAGGKVVYGGRKLSSSLIEPTILADVPESAKVMREEVFGPVVCVNSYVNLDEAIASCNSVPFIFQAGIFTADLDRAMRASRRLNATTVTINESTTFRTDWMPFAGGGVSGLGVSGVAYEVHEQTREKMILIKSKAWEL